MKKIFLLLIVLVFSGCYLSRIPYSLLNKKKIAKIASDDKPLMDQPQADPPVDNNDNQKPVDNNDNQKPVDNNDNQKPVDNPPQNTSAYDALFQEAKASRNEYKRHLRNEGDIDGAMKSNSNAAKIYKQLGDLKANSPNPKDWEAAGKFYRREAEAHYTIADHLAAAAGREAESIDKFNKEAIPALDRLAEYFQKIGHTGEKLDEVMALKNLSIMTMGRAQRKLDSRRKRLNANTRN